MELSLSQRSNGTTIAKPIIGILGVWLLCSLLLLNLSRSFEQALDSVEELGARVNELIQTLHFSEPLRVIKIDDLTLDAQLVYSIRLQVEAEFSDALFFPDVSQALYTTDQFLEKFREYSPIDSKILFFATNMRDYKAIPTNSTTINHLYNELNATVFEAMYTDNNSSPTIYRTFDQILNDSQSLEVDERQSIQKMLADASILLGEYAQLNYLIETMKKSSVGEQVSLLEDELHNRQFRILLLALVVNIFALGAVTFCFYLQSSRSDHRYDEELASEDDPLPEIRESDAQSNNVPEIETANVQAEFVQFEPEHPVESPEPSIPSEEVIEVSIEGEQERHAAINLQEMLDTLGGDLESVLLLLGVFIQDHAQDGEKFRKLLTEDVVQASRIVHSLKGVSGSIKAHDLGEISAHLEMTLKEGLTVEEKDIALLSKHLSSAIEAAGLLIDENS
ncbi:Hpt domain-containing protein [Vibrio makurazakiensis]|uniref:Hpt domain-containing protein n=1 Tax=Vibrio makurazakiensis TaxID=2910250 RepID=UPI003D12CD48